MSSYEKRIYGLDLSDKSIEVCVINAAGEVVRWVTIVNYRKELIFYQELEKIE
jgi:mRNA-degrading endonuclease HigB of HigAB toxin-antitoxin module